MLAFGKSFLVNNLLSLCLQIVTLARHYWGRSCGLRTFIIVERYGILRENVLDRVKSLRSLKIICIKVEMFEDISLNLCRLKVKRIINLL